MTIYIESFIIQNVLINLSLLRLIQISLRPKTNFFRLALASIFGAGFSIVASAYLSNQIMINLLKLLCAIVMIMIAYRQNFKHFLLSFILLFAFTFAFGGMIITISNNSHITNYGVITSSKISMEAICLIIIAMTYIYERLVKCIKFKIKSSGLIYKVVLHYNNKKIKLNAYLDTGNFLNIDGQPVLIVDFVTYAKLMDKNLIDYYLTKAMTIHAGTITGASNLRLEKIDKLELICGKEIKIYNNQYIAINNSNIFKDTNYQALLTPLFL